MWQQTDILTAGQSVGQTAVVPDGDSPPSIETRKRWLQFWSAGLAVDLAPLGQAVFKESKKMFNNDA